MSKHRCYTRSPPGERLPCRQDACQQNRRPLCLSRWTDLPGAPRHPALPDTCVRQRGTGTKGPGGGPAYSRIAPRRPALHMPSHIHATRPVGRLHRFQPGGEGGGTPAGRHRGRASCHGLPGVCLSAEWTRRRGGPGDPAAQEHAERNGAISRSRSLDRDAGALRGRAETMGRGCRHRYSGRCSASSRRHCGLGPGAGSCTDGTCC